MEILGFLASSGAAVGYGLRGPCTAVFLACGAMKGATREDTMGYVLRKVAFEGLSITHRASRNASKKMHRARGSSHLLLCYLGEGVFAVRSAVSPLAGRLRRLTGPSSTSSTGSTMGTVMRKDLLLCYLGQGVFAFRGALGLFAHGFRRLGGSTNGAPGEDSHDDAAQKAPSEGVSAIRRAGRRARSSSTFLLCYIGEGVFAFRAAILPVADKLRWLTGA